MSPSICRFLLATSLFAFWIEALPAQTYTAAVNACGCSGGGDPNPSIGSSAAYRYNTNHFPPHYSDNTGTATVGRSGITLHLVSGPSGHTGTYQDITAGDGLIQWDDVTFGTQTGGTVTFYVNMTVAGTLGGNGAALGSVSLTSQGFHEASWSNWPSVVPPCQSSTGFMGSYCGEGQGTVKFGPLTVASGVPLPMQIRFLANAEICCPGQSVTNVQTLAFGAPGADDTMLPLFETTGGEPVSSAQAHINGSGQPDPDLDLHLDITPDPVPDMQTVVFTAWNGEPGQPAAFFLTSVNGIPIFVYPGITGPFDVDGIYPGPPIPNSIPELTNQTYGVIAATITSAFEIKLSPEVTVMFL